MTGTQTSPNILLIMPDQMRGDCMSLVGHPVLLTPNIDAIGGQGATFTQAYTTCASCIAARRSLLTGQFPASHGMVGYAEGVPLNAPTLPQCLRADGYATAIVGRYMHQSPYTEPYGFETRIPPTDGARRASVDAALHRWRQRLIQVLRDRPEGFTDGERLLPGRPYPALLPHVSGT